MNRLGLCVVAVVWISLGQGCQASPDITVNAPPRPVSLPSDYTPVVLTPEVHFSASQPVVLSFRIDAPVAVSSNEVVYRVRFARRVSELEEEQCPSCVTATHIDDPDDEARLELESRKFAPGVWFWQVRAELPGGQQSEWSSRGSFTVGE